VNYVSPKFVGYLYGLSRKGKFIKDDNDKKVLIQSEEYMEPDQQNKTIIFNETIENKISIDRIKSNYGENVKDIVLFFKFEQESDKKDVSIGYFNHRLFKGKLLHLNSGTFRERLTFGGISIPVLVEF
jgi:hypothetical protein